MKGIFSPTTIFLSMGKEEKHQNSQLFSHYFQVRPGLYLPVVTFSLQMPGVDQMQGYNRRYGRSPIMELPLAINPSGCARSEPLLRTHFKR